MFAIIDPDNKQTDVCFGCMNDFFSYVNSGRAELDRLERLEKAAREEAWEKDNKESTPANLNNNKYLIKTGVDISWVTAKYNAYTGLFSTANSPTVKFINSS